jgi:hypothetical protein
MRWRLRCTFSREVKQRIVDGSDNEIGIDQHLDTNFVPVVWEVRGDRNDVQVTLGAADACYRLETVAARSS